MGERLEDLDRDLDGDEELARCLRCFLFITGDMDDFLLCPLVCLRAGLLLASFILELFEDEPSEACFDLASLDLRCLGLAIGLGDRVRDSAESWCRWLPLGGGDRERELERLLCLFWWPLCRYERDMATGEGERE